MRKGNTFGFIAFCSYGAFWMYYFLIILLATTKVIIIDPVTLGVSFILWGVLSFYLWIPAMTINLILNLIFVSLWPTFFLLAIGNICNINGCIVAGGVLGLFCASCAAYLSFAIVSNKTIGPGFIPVGPAIKFRMRNLQ